MKKKESRMNKLTTWFLVSIAAWLAVGSAQAALLASESFEYDTAVGGVKLSNTVYQGGTGWATSGARSSWEATGSTGLNLDDSNGGAGSSLGDTNGVGNRILSTVNGANARSLATGFALDSDYYTAFLATTDSAGDAFRIEFSYTTPSLASRWTPFELKTDGTISTKAGTVTETSASPVWSSGVTYLVVSKWEATGDHSYTKIFDISAGTNYLTEMDWEAEADVHADGASGATILDVYMTASSEGVSVDEFKIGTTYADVVQNYTVEAAPEPTDLLLSESFDSLDYKLQDIGGGTGWGTNLWASSDGVRLSQDSVSLPTTGISIYGSGSRVNHTLSQGALSTRLMETSLTLSTDYYLSFFVKKSADGIFRIETKNTANSRIRFGTGVDADGTLWTRRYGTTGLSETAAGAVANDTTYMVLAKTTGSGTAAALFEVGVDSVPTNEAAVVWLTAGAGNTAEPQDQLIIAVSAGTVELDELRLGTTFESVTVEDAPLVVADIFAYEDFAYETSSGITGQAGGTGWSTNSWEAIGVTPSLTLGNVGLSLWDGNDPQLSDDGSGHLFHENTTGGTTAIREWETAVSGTFYFAALISQSASGTNGPPQCRFEFYSDPAGASYMRMNVGINDYNDDGSPDLFVDATSQSYPAGAAVNTAKTIPADTTFLLVAKRTADGVFASIFDAGSSPSEPVTWDVEQAGATSISFKRLKIALSRGVVRVDEIALGETFAGTLANLPAAAIVPTAIDGIPVSWISNYWDSAVEYSAAGGTAGDADSDGRSNLDEYRADTLPNDVNSVLKVLSASVGGADANVTYQNGGANADVFVDYRPDLVSGDWMPLATNAAPAATANAYLHAGGADAKAFYRLRAQRND
jgi:hypothetical protein